jgi:hypothetical protein
MLEHENSYLHDVNPVGDRHFAVAIFVHEVLLPRNDLIVKFSAP